MVGVLVLDIMPMVASHDIHKNPIQKRNRRTKAITIIIDACEYSGNFIAAAITRPVGLSFTKYKKETIRLY